LLPSAQVDGCSQPLAECVWTRWALGCARTPRGAVQLKATAWAARAEPSSLLGVLCVSYSVSSTPSPTILRCPSLTPFARPTHADGERRQAEDGGGGAARGAERLRAAAGQEHGERGAAQGQAARAAGARAAVQVHGERHADLAVRTSSQHAIELPEVVFQPKPDQPRIVFRTSSSNFSLEIDH
jgi:hypothetical protein